MAIIKKTDKINPKAPPADTAFWESYFENTLEGLIYCQMFFDESGYPDDFVFLQVNKSFETLTGLKGASGLKVTALIPGIKSSNPELFEVCGRVSLTGKPERLEMYIEAMDKWFSIAFYSPGKKFFVAAFRNITDLKNIAKDLENSKIAARNVLEDLQVEKEKLAEAMAKDEALLQSIGDGVVATDQSGKIILMNKVAEDLLGFTSAEVIGKLFDHAIVMQDAEGNQVPDNLRPITLALSSGTTTTTTDTNITDYHFVRKNGMKFPVAITVTPVILDSKTVGGMVVFRDITKEKEIEHAKSEFISIASHQLRTPVSGLNWLIEALQSSSDDFPPQQKKYVKDLSTFSKRLVALIEDLLNFSRIELKTAVIAEKDKIEIQSLIDEFLKEIKPYADSKNHSLLLGKRLTEPLTIEINKKSLYNVLQNLMSNAIDYSPKNTEVTLDLEKNDGFVKISISNVDSTIPKADQQYIFERFYRSESAKKIKAEGTGLGLYIAKVIVEGIGGKIGFRSEPGEDTIFWFTVPIK